MWEKRAKKAKKRSLVGTFESEILEKSEIIRNFWDFFSLCLLDKVFIVGFEMVCVIGEVGLFMPNYRK